MILKIKKSNEKYQNVGLHFQNIKIVNGSDYIPNNNYIAIIEGRLSTTKQKTKYYIYPNNQIVLAIY